jgi:hypothetical protein
MFRGGTFTFKLPSTPAPPNLAPAEEEFNFLQEMVNKCRRFAHTAVIMEQCKSFE